MARNLRYLGLAILAATAALLVVGETGWAPAAKLDPWIRPALVIGVACLAGGILLAAFAPVRRTLSRGRCARCGVRIERGQTYCLDHLQETVNEYRDHARDLGR